MNFSPLLVCLFLVPVAASEDTDSSSIPTWEIALAVGAGVLALLLIAYSIYICCFSNKVEDTDDIEKGQRTKKSSVKSSKTAPEKTKTAISDFAIKKKR